MASNIKVSKKYGSRSIKKKRKEKKKMERKREREISGDFERPLGLQDVLKVARALRLIVAEGALYA